MTWHQWMSFDDAKADDVGSVLLNPRAVRDPFVIASQFAKDVRFFDVLFVGSVCFQLFWFLCVRNREKWPDTSRKYHIAVIDKTRAADPDEVFGKSSRDFRRFVRYFLKLYCQVQETLRERRSLLSRVSLYLFWIQKRYYSCAFFLLDFS